MNAQAILAAVREKYLLLTSYADEGTVEISGTGFEPAQFKTYFVRPDKIRFAWRSWHPYFGKSRPAHENLVWCDGDNTGSLFLDQLQRGDKFVMYVAGATGVSSGSVHMILNLLAPDSLQLRSAWQDMHDVKIVGVENVREIACHHLIGSGIKPEDTEAWIGVDDALPHRLRQHLKFTQDEMQQHHDEMTEQLSAMGKKPPPLPKMNTVNCYFTYDYQRIRLNPRLSDDLFKFDPASDSNRIFGDGDEDEE